MNETSTTASVDGLGNVRRRQRARVDLLAHDDARIRAQPRVELPDPTSTA